MTKKFQRNSSAMFGKNLNWSSSMFKIHNLLGNMPRYVTQHDVPYNSDFVLHKILKVETYLH